MVDQTDSHEAMAEALDNGTFEMPVSKRCYHWLKISFADGTAAAESSPAFAALTKTMRMVDSEDDCMNPLCSEVPEPVDPSLGHLAHSGPHDSHDHDEQRRRATLAFSSVWNCTVLGKREYCIKILRHIKKLEKLFAELTVARNVTHTLREQIGAEKKVDMAVPPDGSRGELKLLSKMVMDLDLDGAKIETVAGRPLQPVWCPDMFDCHGCKIRRYAPANCSCTKDACSCSRCVWIHVEHSVKDYEDVVDRLRLGITRMRAMPRPKPGPMPAASTAATGAGGGCAMPGVRNAKHLKNYTKAQTEAYNSSK
ncbi:hypothetical protein LTR27_007026 [Elasticomyces elasticus]|nr:hypothetical protein LTR27_007026 [Elasticomyces elasticus]